MGKGASIEWEIGEIGCKEPMERVRELGRNGIRSELGPAICVGMDPAGWRVQSVKFHKGGVSEYSGESM